VDDRVVIFLQGLGGDWVAEEQRAQLGEVSDRLLDELYLVLEMTAGVDDLDAAVGEAMFESFCLGMRTATVELCAQLIEAGIDARLP
jgi:hypothetical protein